MFAKHCNENLTAVSGVHNHHAGTLNGVKDYIQLLRDGLKDNCKITPCRTECLTYLDSIFIYCKTFCRYKLE